MADVKDLHGEDGAAGIGTFDREGEPAAEALLDVCWLAAKPPAVDGPVDGDEPGSGARQGGPLMPPA